MDTHETHESIVRLADLRQRFDLARQGRSLDALGRAYADLTAQKPVSGTGHQEGADGAGQVTPISDASGAVDR